MRMVEKFYGIFGGDGGGLGRSLRDSGGGGLDCFLVTRFPCTHHIHEHCETEAV